MNIYFYKLVADGGGAPCIQRELLSLAICKPMIRRKAKQGDLILGFAANSLSRDNRLIYAARISKRLTGQDYYTSDRYTQRADCIYDYRNERFVRRKGARHHRPEDLPHDLGKPSRYLRAYVLISRNFRYFGKAGTAEYKKLFPLVKRAVERLGRAHRVHHDLRLRDQFLEMEDWICESTTKRVLGPPTSAPSRRLCYNGGSCAAA